MRLYFDAYPDQDIIVAHSEIVNGERRAVKLHKYASSMLSLDCSRYVLTEYSGDWASEVAMTETELNFGKKVLDTKLGSRASMFMPSFFQLSLDGPSTETQGTVLVGTLAWTGNYRFTFEVDQNNRLRLISGINPYFSARELKAGETFTTPDFIFTLSTQGRGQASRNFHSWARQYRLKNGQGDRMTLLNNWEATYFDFDEQKLVGLMDDAVRLGVDMFLLDDGWFGNKYPRSSDHQGLGDWQETETKLPHRVGYLCEQAAKRGIKFGIWPADDGLSADSLLQVGLQQPHHQHLLAPSQGQAGAPLCRLCARPVQRARAHPGQVPPPAHDAVFGWWRTHRL